MYYFRKVPKGQRVALSCLHWNPYAILLSILFCYTAKRYKYSFSPNRIFITPREKIFSPYRIYFSPGEIIVTPGVTYDLFCLILE